MGTPLILLLVLGAVVVIFVGIYNGLVQKRIACDNAWSQISVQLKRRHDLIPNLVETVKGYASHEKDTLERVIRARQTAVDAKNVGDAVKAENMLSGALRQLFALSESYPDLKANQNFLQLQEEVVSTENRVGFSRQHYNDSVGVYNTAIEQFPGNFVKSFGNFPMRVFFELDEAQAKAVQEPPRVSFS